MLSPLPAKQLIKDQRILKRNENELRKKRQEKKENNKVEGKKLYKICNENSIVSPPLVPLVVSLQVAPKERIVETLNPKGENERRLME